MRRTFRDTAETIITAVLIFVALQATTQSFQIEGSSMDPTLTSGERLLVNRFVYARSDWGVFGDDDYVFHGPERGDIIIFQPPTGSRTDFVKRIIAIPGDEVNITDGDVFVNGEITRYVDMDTSSRGGDYPLTVPEGEYFVLGDNRRVSNDSRNWGTVPGEDIVGRAWVIYWPLPNLNIFN